MSGINFKGFFQSVGNGIVSLFKSPAGKQAASAAQTYETTGIIEAIEPGSITFSHQPVPALGWPAMTMAFHVADAALIRGYKRGDRALRRVIAQI